MTLRPNPAAANPTGPIAINGDDWKIILERVRGVFSLDSVEKETAAGDSTTQYGHNALLDGQYTFQGKMVEGEIGIQHLINRAKNPTGDVTLSLSSGRKQVVKLLITRLWYDWRATGVNVPIVFTAVIHNTAPSGIESTVS